MRELKGNIFCAIGHCDAICVTTNGILRKNGDAICGRGIALTAQQTFPDFEQKLVQLIQSDGNIPHLVLASKGTAIVSFPTKYHWKDSSDMKLINKSAELLVKMANEQKWTCVLLPRPGCSNGGLQWDKVRPVLGQVFDSRFVIVDYV